MLQKGKKKTPKPSPGYFQEGCGSQELAGQTPSTEGLESKEQGIGKRLESMILEAFPNLNDPVSSAFLQDEGFWNGLALFCRDLVPLSQAFQRDATLGQPNLRKGWGAWWAPALWRSQWMSHRYPVRSPIRTIYPLISQAGTQKQDLESSWQQFRAPWGFQFRNLGVWVVLFWLRREQMRFHQKQARIYLIAESCTGIFTVGPMEGWNR